MEAVTLIFIVLNAFLIGLGFAVVAFVRSATRECQRTLEASRTVKTECSGLIGLVQEAHNAMAQRLLSAEDKIKGMELRHSQQAIRTNSAR